MRSKKKKNCMISFLLILILFLCIFLSLAYGVSSVDIRSVAGVFFSNGASPLEISIVTARIPRTIFGILAGAALGVSGLLMQSITGNPVADPSILGVNTGASLFVVCGIAYLPMKNGNQYIWLAFSGAALTAVLVYGLASMGRGGATPIRLALAGAAASTALQSLVNTVMLPDSQVMDQFRFWQVGSIGGASFDDIRLITPYLAAGFLIAFLLVPSLNAMALGDDMATGLGVNVTVIRALAAFSGVLLCASVTALAGPVSFLGLMVPHFIRLLVGPDLKRILPLTMLCGSCVLLLSDILGRIAGKPGELESGIITSLLGAPVFIAVIRRVKVRSL